MTTIDTGGPAFPQPNNPAEYGRGMTLRQYAAIHLKVPNSGTDWLDEMIKQANKIDAELLTHAERSNTL